MNAVTQFALNRRRLLLGLAAASTTAAGVAVEAAAAPVENPELVRLSAELPAIAAAYHDAYAIYRAAYDAWVAQTPLAPDELTEPGTCWPLDEGAHPQPGETEMKILGGYLRRPGERFPRRIVVQAWQFRWQISNAQSAKRKAKKSGALADFMAAEAEIERLETMYRVASVYESKFSGINARARAWHDDAYPVMDRCRDALERHVDAIIREHDLTMEGLVIKAQALAEWSKVDYLFPISYGKNWHSQIAASILRHAGGGVA